MFKSILPVGIGIVFFILSPPVKSETLWNPNNTYLNYNQPYKNTGKEEEPFLNVDDNNDMWNMIIDIRNRKLGYEDTEFINKVNFYHHHKIHFYTNIYQLN